jgi:hypothetical protein
MHRCEPHAISTIQIGRIFLEPRCRCGHPLTGEERLHAGGSVYEIVNPVSFSSSDGALNHEHIEGIGHASGRDEHETVLNGTDS